MRIIYDQISPFTGNRSVVVEQDFDKNDFVWLCMETGYQTYENLLFDGSETQQVYHNIQPKDIQETKFVDGDNRAWYKVILLTPFSVLMPVTEGDFSYWNVYTLVDTFDGDDNAILMFESSEGVMKYKKPDIDTAISFSGDKFSEAMDRYQMLNAMVGGKVLEDLQEESNEK